MRPPTLAPTHWDWNGYTMVTKPTAEIAVFAAALPPRGRLLAIDLGTKTLGLAVSDTTRMIATALETIRRRRRTDDFAALAAVVARHEIVGTVLGYPLNLDGTKGPRAQATESFARALGEAFPLPLLLWDERLTTVAAERALLEADTSRARRAEKIDMVAAALILRGALERMLQKDDA
jgi:putative Holliday junction resolvase